MIARPIAQIEPRAPALTPNTLHLTAHLLHLQNPCAVAEAIRFDANLIQHPEIQVAQRRIFGVLQVSWFLDPTAALANHHDGQIVMVVSVPVGDSTSVKNQAVV